LQAICHALLAPLVLLTGGLSGAGCSVGAEIRLQADAADTVGIGELLAVTGVAVRIHIDKMQGNSLLQSLTGRLHQGIGRLHQQIDRSCRFQSGLFSTDSLVADHRDLRQTAQRPQERRLQSGGQLDGYGIGVDVRKGHAHQLGELHTVMEHRQGMHRTESFKIQAFGHGQSRYDRASFPRIRVTARRNRSRGCEPPAAAILRAYRAMLMPSRTE